MDARAFSTDMLCCGSLSQSAVMPVQVAIFIGNPRTFRSLPVPLPPSGGPRRP